MLLLYVYCVVLVVLSLRELPVGKKSGNFQCPKSKSSHFRSLALIIPEFLQYIQV